MEPELTIQEASDATGLSAHTLRYYEKAGLLAPIERNDGGHRRYRQRDVDAVLFLAKLRLTGMPIQGVREYAELVRQGPDTIAERKALLERHRRDVCQQMAVLEKNLAVLDYKIGLYERNWIPGDASDPCIAELRKLCTPLEKS